MSTSKDEKSESTSEETSEEVEKTSSEASTDESSSSADGEGYSNDRTAKRQAGSIRSIMKIGVVGDGTVGKSTLLLAYICDAFLTDYTPTVFDNFSAIETIEGQNINVILWDTAGQDDYSQIRTTCYTKCDYDFFLLCFSTVHKDSFDNVKHKWLEELKEHVPTKPYVLVGTKTDLRDEVKEGDDTDVITSKMGEKRAKEIKALRYLECTAKDPNSVVAMIRDAIHVVVDPRIAQRSKDIKKWAKQAKKEEKEEKKMMKLAMKAKEKEDKKKGEGGRKNSDAPLPEKKDDKKPEKDKKKK